MRFILVAAVLGLLGCAGAGTVPGSVVQGLTQAQVDQTQWVYNAETEDLVSVSDLQGPRDGYQAVSVRLYTNGVLILGQQPTDLGVVDVPRSGDVHPGGGHDQTSPGSGGAVDVGSIDVSRPITGGAFAPDLVVGDGFGFGRFDDDMLHALEGSDSVFFVFHPGCA